MKCSTRSSFRSSLASASFLAVSFAVQSWAAIDLSHWKLTLPVDSGGGTGGTAAEVKPIPQNYSNPPYFYTVSDGLIFSAPTNGATTSGSPYPRSELRELNADGSNAAWGISDGGVLSATLAVNEVPKLSGGGDGRVIVGQIHGPKDELCRLYYDNGRLYFHDDKAGNGKETKFVLKSNSGETTAIPLNASFSYTIRATSSQLEVTATYNGKTYLAAEPISSFWPGKPLYFKAGAYVQVGKPGSGAGSTGTGKGTVTFYALSIPSHNGTGGSGSSGGSTSSSSGGGGSSGSGSSGSGSGGSSGSGSSSSSGSGSSGSGGGQPPLAVTASSFETKGSRINGPINTLDDNNKTYWAAAGGGQWLQYAFGNARSIGAVTITWLHGDKRSFTYSIAISDDGQQWTTVVEKKSSQESSKTVDRINKTARFLRITGYGNDGANSQWTSIVEVKIDL